MSKLAAIIILAFTLALHNAQRIAPVPLFDELRFHLVTDYAGVGNLFGAYLLAYAVFQIPAGMLADRLDNKRLIVCGAGLCLLASFAFATAGSYTIALISRLALGISGALLFVPAVRHIVVSFPKKRRGSAMGFADAGSGLGMALSMFFLPVIAQKLNLRWAYLILSMFTAVILSGILLGLPSVRRPAAVTLEQSKFSYLVCNARFWKLTVHHFLGMLLTYAVMGWLPTFMRTDFGYSAVRAGVVGTSVTVALGLFSPVAGILSDRLSARIPVLLIGSLMSVIGLVVFLLSRNPKMVVAAALLLGVSISFSIPLTLLLFGESFSSAGAGLAVSVAGTTGQFASAISGLMFGYVLDQNGSFAAVWGLALIFGLVRIPFLLWAGEKSQRPA